MLSSNTPLSNESILWCPDIRQPDKIDPLCVSCTAHLRRVFGAVYQSMPDLVSLSELVS